MRRRFKWLLIAVGGLLSIVVVATSIVYFNYSTWRSEQLDRLKSGGQIVATEVGPIEYVLHGERGPIMLFLHGSPGGYDAGPAVWQHFRLLIPSRPGYLSTSIDAGRTPEEQARAFAALLNTLGIEDPVVVMATSGGGPSGIAFAALYPEKTAALIALVAVSQPLTDVASLPRLLQSDFALWMTISTIHKLLGDEGIVADKIENFVPVLWNLWPLSLRDTGLQNDTRQFAELALPIDEIKVPTLIFHGTADISVPLAHSELLAEQIPEARFHVIEGGGHMISFTHQEEIEAAITQFLQDFGLQDVSEL